AFGSAAYPHPDPVSDRCRALVASARQVLMLPSSGVVLVESVVEGFEADAEDAGGAGFVASGLLERSKNELAFGVLAGRSNRDHQIGLSHLRHRLGSHAERRRQMLGAYHVTRADDDSPLDHVSKLAHVPGPRMPPENVQRALVDTADATAVTILDLLDERLRESGKVLQPIPTCRQLDLEALAS